MVKDSNKHLVYFMMDTYIKQVIFNETFPFPKNINIFIYVGCIWRDRRLLLARRQSWPFPSPRLRRRERGLRG